MCGREQPGENRRTRKERRPEGFIPHGENCFMDAFPGQTTACRRWRCATAEGALSPIGN